MQTEPGLGLRLQGSPGIAERGRGAAGGARGARGEASGRESAVRETPHSACVSLLAQSSRPQGPACPGSIQSEGACAWKPRRQGPSQQELVQRSEAGLRVLPLLHGWLLYPGRGAGRRAHSVAAGRGPALAHPAGQMGVTGPQLARRLGGLGGRGPRCRGMVGRAGPEESERAPSAPQLPHTGVVWGHGRGVGTASLQQAPRPRLLRAPTQGQRLCLALPLSPRSPRSCQGPMPAALQCGQRRRAQGCPPALRGQPPAHPTVAQAGAGSQSSLGLAACAPQQARPGPVLFPTEPRLSSASPSRGHKDDSW